MMKMTKYRGESVLPCLYYRRQEVDQRIRAEEDVHAEKRGRHRRLRETATKQVIAHHPDGESKGLEYTNKIPGRPGRNGVRGKAEKKDFHVQILE